MAVTGVPRTDGVLESCEPCQIAGSSTWADGYCGDCKEHMCQTCFDHHLKYKASRDHVLAPLKLGKSYRKSENRQTEHCKKHIKEQLAYFCRQHDKVACRDCTLLEHKECKMESIKHLAKNFQESPEFNSTLGKIRQLETETEDRGNNIRRKRAGNTSLAEKALEEIKRFRKELNDYLDCAEAEIVREVERVSKENENRMSKLEEELAKLRVDVVKLKNSINATLYQEDRLFIRFVENKGFVTDLEKSATVIKRQKDINSFTFEPEQRLKEIIGSKVKLGSLTIISPTKFENTSQRKEEREEMSRKRTSVKSEGDEIQKQLTKKSKIREVATTSSRECYLSPDPRSAGFDIGKRVRGKWKVNADGMRKRSGTVTGVDPSGFVNVTWNDGSTDRMRAGAGGYFHVKLI